MLNIYHDESKRLTDEAEDLIALGLQKRDEAMAMLKRANELALAYAKDKDRAIQEEASEIPW